MLIKKLFKIDEGLSPQPQDLKLTKMESFGDSSLPIQNEWPTQDELQLLPLDKRIKLNYIAYKHHENRDVLSGLQLEFTKEVKSTLFETKHAQKSDILKYEKVNVSKKLAQISMYVVNDNCIAKLRFID